MRTTHSRFRRSVLLVNGVNVICEPENVWFGSNNPQGIGARDENYTYSNFYSHTMFISAIRFIIQNYRIDGPLVVKEFFKRETDEYGNQIFLTVQYKGKWITAIAGHYIPAEDRQPGESSYRWSVYAD